MARISGPNQRERYSGSLTFLGEDLDALVAQLNTSLTDHETRVADIETQIAEGLPGDLLPDTDDAYDLGSTALRWHDLYLGRLLQLGGGSLETIQILAASSGSSVIKNISNAPLAFGTNNLVRVTLTAAGVLDLAIGQVKFPGTQNASADANTLDDYEEGTFTPTDSSGAALTLATANGNYVKVGQQVTATFDVTYPATADGSAASLTMPFGSSSAGSINGYGGAIGYTTSATAITAYLPSGTGSVQFYTFGGVARTNAQMSGLTVRVTVTYRASA